jgi:hypothetical protein
MSPTPSAPPPLQLKDHIVVCGSLVNLFFFVQPLRYNSAPLHLRHHVWSLLCVDVRVCSQVPICSAVN